MTGWIAAAFVVGLMVGAKAGWEIAMKRIEIELEERARRRV